MRAEPSLLGLCRTCSEWCKQYEKLWQKYQTEGIAHNITLQMFCSMNNVPYNSFEKYLKTRRNMSDIHPVSITDIPQEATGTAADPALTLTSESV